MMSSINVLIMKIPFTDTTICKFVHLDSYTPYTCSNFVRFTQDGLLDVNFCGVVHKEKVHVKPGTLRLILGTIAVDQRLEYIHVCIVQNSDGNETTSIRIQCVKLRAYYVSKYSNIIRMNLVEKRILRSLIRT